MALFTTNPRNDSVGPDFDGSGNGHGFLLI